MSGTSVIKQGPPKDLGAELRAFIGSATRSSSHTIEYVKKGFALLKAIPSAREGILEFFATIFDKSVSNFVKRLDSFSTNDTRNTPLVIQTKEDNLIDEIHNGLSALLYSNSLWAVVFSSWAASQLGILSSKYTKRGRSSGVLSESFHQWMSCRAARSLLDLCTKGFTVLSETKYETDNTNRLYEQCVEHTPHFDWVVAHIGSCFPAKLIEGVLEWGLKNHNHESTDKKKIESVLGILVHLNGSHSQELRKAFWRLFQWSLEPSSNNQEFLHKAGVVPFVMNLAVHSSTLLSTLSSDASEHLTSKNFTKFKLFVDDWIRQMDGRQLLLDLVVHIILYTEDNVEDVVNILLNTTQHDDPEVSSVGNEVLDLLIKEMDFAIRVSGAKIPLLESIMKNCDWIIPFTLNESETTYSAVVTILSLIGRQEQNILVKVVSHILLNSKNDDHLASVVKFTQGFGPQEVLTPALSLCLSGCSTSSSNIVFCESLWTNMSKLLKWESSGTLVSLPMQEAVWENLLTITEQVTIVQDIDVAHLMYEVVWRSVRGSKDQPSVHLTLTIIEATVAYFYICLLHAEGISELKGVQKVNSLLNKLCQGSSVARSMALRAFLENCLFRAPSVLFGAIPEPQTRLIQPLSSLLNETHKHGTTSLLALRHSSVFHAGVIGNGKRKATPSCPTPPSKVVHNTRLLISALDACCNCESPQAKLDAVISLALLLVEMVSPDVMYNGLPWPEEEFCKVTVERDLHIRRQVDSIPLLWSLLEYIAYHRPALCYCSVLLRALVASVMGQWAISSQQGRAPGYNQSLISNTTRVLQLMALSQLLPPPLNALSDIIPTIPPGQVLVILRECIWNYMRDHVPSPAMFTRDSNGNMWRDPSTCKPPKQYTEALRLVMKHNIISLGALYNTLFVQNDED